MVNPMKVSIRKEQSGLYQAMGEWLVHEHNECPSALISEVFNTYATTPGLDVTQLRKNSFKFPTPDENYLPIKQPDRTTIDDAIKRATERYQIN